MTSGTIRFSNTIEIDRPRAEVFAYLGDLEHTPEWNWAITDVRKVTGGPIAVGTEYRQTRSVPTSTTETLSITGYDPPRLIEVEGRLGPFPAGVSYRLTETGTSTIVTNTVELEPPRLLRLASPLLSRRIRDAVAKNLGVLKDRLESGSD